MGHEELDSNSFPYCINIAFITIMRPRYFVLESVGVCARFKLRGRDAEPARSASPPQQLATPSNWVVFRLTNTLASRTV